MVFLTILMSTFNRREFLPTALDCVRRQTFADWRLIVVNDGGEDVADLIAACGDSRIEYYNRPHLGKAAQLNFALGLVKSKYVGYLDDDDEALPGHFEGLYRAAEESGREFVYSNVQPVAINPDGSEELWPVNDADIEWKDIRIDNAINHSTILHTKRLADEVGPYDERMQVLIDYDYIKRLAAKVKPFHVHAATYRWKLRMDSEGNINSISGLWTQAPLAAGRSLLAFFEKDPESLAAFRMDRERLKRQQAADVCEKARLVAENDGLVADRDAIAADRDAIAADRDAIAADRDAIAADRDAIAADRDAIAADRDRLLNSTCWKITAPLRSIMDWVRHMDLYRRLLGLVHHGSVAAFGWRVTCGEGPEDYIGFKRRMLHVSARRRRAEVRASRDWRVRISVIVPLYNTDLQMLKEMVESVVGQTYGNWELCLVDGSDDRHPEVEATVRTYADADPRVRYRKLERNLGISGNTNAAIAMSEGDYIALFDHDDILHPSALYEVARAIVDEGADFVYTDEGVFNVMEGGMVRMIKAFKPDFSPFLLRGCNYICHLSAFSRSLMMRVGMFDSSCDGSQDHDMIMRLTDVADKIVHVRKRLYFWRIHPQSTASDTSVKSYASVGGICAVRKSLSRQGAKGVVSSLQEWPTLYRTRYESDSKARVGIVILDNGIAGKAEALADSLATGTDWENMSVSVSQFETATINSCVGKLDAEYVVFIDACAVAVDRRWLEELIAMAGQRRVGAVGARLVHADGCIYSVGLTVDGRKGIGNAHSRCGKGDPGDVFRLFLPAEWSAVSIAGMMVRKDVFLRLDGLDTDFSPVLAGVDFCLRLRELGLSCVTTPMSVIGHTGDCPWLSAAESDRSEVLRFRRKWFSSKREGDPFWTVRLEPTVEYFIRF